MVMLLAPRPEKFAEIAGWTGNGPIPVKDFAIGVYRREETYDGVRLLHPTYEIGFVLAGECMTLPANMVRALLPRLQEFCAYCERENEKVTHG